MDRTSLKNELEKFKQTCQTQGYIEGDFYLDEASPFDASSYVVKMVIKQSWLDNLGSRGKALEELVRTLFATTEAKTRESVFTLAIYSENERDLMQLPSYREPA
mgnify:CR=1 FL=1